MVTVTRNGENIDDVVIDQDIVVRVGRRAVLSSGQPTSLALVLYLDAPIDIKRSDLIEVHDDGLRFSGRISDIPRTWWEDHPDNPDAWMWCVRVQAVGPLAYWGLDWIGDEPWPAETVADRAARIASTVGLPLQVQGGGSLRVIARDVDHRQAIDILDELATDAAGWLYDFAGRTYIQALDYRRQPPGALWQDQTGTWNDFPDDEGWDDSQQPSMIPLPPDAVGWTPEWLQTSSIANKVRVRYGPTDEVSGDQAFVEMSDAASIAVHKQHEVSIATRLESSADALLRAGLTLERAANPRWELDDVDVFWEALDPATATALAAALPGQRVQVTALPEPGPATAFEGCIEGWDERWDRGDDGSMLRTLTLHLSDLRSSFAVLTWDQVTPTTLTWDATTAVWDDVISSGDLVASGG